jgi:S-DNA-T family DNA segregation ATPase FtsK/SpoIIIE
LVAALDEMGPGTVALIDDADQLDDPTASLAALVGDAAAGIHVVAAGRADRLRAAYGHWTATLRSSRIGVLLSPDVLDGDLLGVQLPPRVQLPPLPGRGWLVANGSVQVCQLAAAAGDPITGAAAFDAVVPDAVGGRSQRSRRVRSS